jgi:hypothetical protein
MMMATPQYEKGNLYQLPITDLRPDPDQPRKVIDPAALEDLKDSIREYGIITQMLFRVGEQGRLIIIAGERRYQAALQLGLFVVPGICVEGRYAEIALIENRSRQDRPQRPDLRHHPACQNRRKARIAGHRRLGKEDLPICGQSWMRASPWKARQAGRCEVFHFQSSASINRAASPPHILHVPRSTRERPTISPSRSCILPVTRHRGHQILARISFCACSGTCFQRFIDVGVNFGNGINLFSLLFFAAGNSRAPCGSLPPCRGEIRQRQYNIP